MLHDIDYIRKCVEKDGQEQLTVDLKNVSNQLNKVINKSKKEKERNRSIHDLQNVIPLSVATFGVSSLTSIDNTASDISPNSSEFLKVSQNDNKNNNNSSSNSTLGRHSRYINKNTDCYTIQNTYCNLKEIEPSVKFPNANRTASTSSNNSSNTSGIVTNFTNSDMYLFQTDNKNVSSFKNNNDYLNNNYYVDVSTIGENININNAYLTNMLQNYPKKSTITHKLFDYKKNNNGIYNDSPSVISANASSESSNKSNYNDYKKNEETRQLKLLHTLLKSPSKNSYV